MYKSIVSMSYVFSLSVFIISSESSTIRLPVKFINLTPFTIAGYQKEYNKNSFLLAPHSATLDEANHDDDSVQELPLHFRKFDKSIDGKYLYKAFINVQAMNLNPPFFYKGSVDEWVVYYKTNSEQPKHLCYTLYEQHANKHCEVFIQSNMPDVHAYRDITFTKISSKL